MIYCVMEDGVMAIDDGRPGEETIILDPALVAALEGEHGHTCPNCGNRWRHRASDIHSEEENEAAHTCTRCGVEQYWKDDPHDY